MRILGEFLNLVRQVAPALNVGDRPHRRKDVPEEKSEAERLRERNRQLYEVIVEEAQASQYFRKHSWVPLSKRTADDFRTLLADPQFRAGERHMIEKMCERWGGITKTAREEIDELLRTEGA